MGTLKPFTLEWTVNKTVERLLKSVDFSLNKVVERIAEFQGDSAKSEEILRTISLLSALRTAIENYRKPLNQNLSTGE